MPTDCRCGVGCGGLVGSETLVRVQFAVAAAAAAAGVAVC